MTANQIIRQTALLLALFLVLLLSGISEAQTTVFSDDFNTNQDATFTTSGAIGASAWSVARSGADFGARRNISPAQLELTNDVDATLNANGWILASTPSSSFTSPYNTILNSNPGLVTWTFNMRQVRPDPAGFASGSYGVAFILAGTSNTNNNTGSGYAVVLGQSGATDSIRLTRYSGGIQGTLTNLIVSNTGGLADFGAEYLSIKVTYTPAIETWELFLRNDGVSAFADPAAGSLTSQGTIVDSTSTGSSLPLMGAWWQGSTAISQLAFFDFSRSKRRRSVVALANRLRGPKSRVQHLSRTQRQTCLCYSFARCRLSTNSRTTNHFEIRIELHMVRRSEANG